MSYGFKEENQNAAVSVIKPSLLTALTSSLSFYPYQKDERALPGNLLTIRCFPPHSEIKFLSLLLHNSLYSSAILLNSVSVFRELIILNFSHIYGENIVIGKIIRIGTYLDFDGNTSVEVRNTRISFAVPTTGYEKAESGPHKERIMYAYRN
jgi:hypothetical protein